MPTLSRSPFGRLPDGSDVEVVTLVNNAGVTARILTWGATLQSLEIPDRDGNAADVVLGYATIDQYLHEPEFFGATVGRFANRIMLGRFALDGSTYNLARTDPPNTLHGGARGFDKRVWQIADTHADDATASVTFRLLSPDGEEGFPGTLLVDAAYTLRADATIDLDFRATTHAPTVLNLTNHSYFNLAGEASGRSALGHTLSIAADEFLPVDDTMIPTGEIASVHGTPFDFRDETAIDTRLRDGRNEQIVRGRGYDHNMVLRGGVTAAPRHAATLHDPHTGRLLEISTTEPGMQFYSGNFLDATRVGKSGLVYRQGDGVAFETQHFPDSPNRSEFPSTRLDPGTQWASRTTWRFSVRA